MPARMPSQAQLMHFASAAESYLGLSEECGKIIAGHRDLFQVLEKPEVEFRQLHPKRAEAVAERIGAEAWKLLLQEEAEQGGGAHRFAADLMLESVLPTERDVLGALFDVDLHSGRQIKAAQEDFAEAARLLEFSGPHQMTVHENTAALATASLILVRDGRVEAGEVTKRIFQARREQLELTRRAQPAIRAIGGWTAPRPSPEPPHKDDYDPPEKETPMPQDALPEAGMTDLVNAVSRLQDQARSATGGGLDGPDTGFDRLLDDTTYRVLGVPNLLSETALAMPPGKMADKLQDGLDQVIELVPAAEGNDFRFNPTQARLQVMSDGGARGGQAIIAQAVDLVRPAVSAAIARLDGAQCCCTLEEVDIIRQEIEDRLTDLSVEVGTGTGIFAGYVQSLLHQIWVAALDLAQAFAVPVAPNRSGLSDTSLSIIDSISNRGRPILHHPVEVRKDVCSEPPLLQLDTNSEVIRVLFLYIDRVTLLVLGEGSDTLGAHYARLHAIENAIPPNVDEVRRALGLGGISPVDLTANFIGENDTAHTIELDRLLDWIARDASSWRGRLGDSSTTERDLQFLRHSLETQIEALDSIRCEEGSGASLPALSPRNDFAAGRRQINELIRVMQSGIAEVDAIFDLIDAELPQARRGTA